MQYLTQEESDNLDFIKEILAKTGFLGIRNIVRLQSGSRSIAYYADDYVLRFPKTETIWQVMQREKKYN